MDERAPRGPFEEPDNGVYIGEPSPKYFIPPPIPTNNIPVISDSENFHKENTDTEPLEVIDVEVDNHNTETSNDEVFFFRRGIRDVLSRLLTRRRTPKVFLVLLYGGLIAIVAPVVIFLLNPNYPLQAGWVGLGTLLSSYPVTREVYRWRTRTVTMVKTAKGMHITYHQPTNIFLWFSGTGNGDTEFIEGSVATSMQTDWLNRLIFWGCGTIIISAKIEADKAYFDNIPHVKRLQAFLN